MEQNKNIWIWVVVGIALLFLLGSFGMGGYGIMGFGFIFMVLFWVAVVWIVVSLINSAQSGKNDEGALEILKKRYAKGEITKKQYDKMKKEM